MYNDIEAISGDSALRHLTVNAEGVEYARNNHLYLELAGGEQVSMRRRVTPLLVAPLAASM
jgi:hypothetical protein